MKMEFKKIVISFFLLLFIGCGNNRKEESNNLSLELPFVVENLQEKQTLKSSSDIDAIRSQENILSFGYYKANSKTSEGKSRWYTSQLEGGLKGYVFSLMPIETIDGKVRAGWGEVSKDASHINIIDEKNYITNIADNNSYDYKDWGLNVQKHNLLIQKDIEMIRNSTVDIKWWFFKASNGFWYIVNNSSIYKFASNNGAYDWQKLNLEGLKIQFFIENGVKKMKLIPHSMNKNLIGIDVSKHNGSINWDMVKNDDVTFTYIKTSEGYVGGVWSEDDAFDSQFTTNMDNAIARGLLVGAYHRVVPDANRGVEEAKKEAHYFIKKIRPYYTNHKLLPPAIDIEKSVKDDKNALTEWILAFAKEIEDKLGMKPILYMNQNYSNTKVDLTQLPYKLWIAKYMYSAENGTVINSVDELHEYDANFKPDKSFFLWQFTETANDVDGVSSTHVDKNIFEGTLDNLNALLVQVPQTDATLTYMSPSGTPVKKSNKILYLYGENLKNVEKVFIAGVDITGFSVHDERYIAIETTERHGGNLAYGVPFGYRDVIVKFTNGSKLVLKDGINIMEEDLSLGAYPETILQNRYTDNSYAKDLNAFYATSYGQDLLGQCTWYVYGRLVELVDKKFFSITLHDNIKSAFWGTSGRDAKNWSTLLGISAKGISTAITPLPLDKRKKGLLSIWECGTHGHVGFVEEVGGANKEWYILSDFNRGLHTSYRKQKYKFDSSQDIEGAIDDKVGSCYPTFYNLIDSSW